jgi:hypothetical protein
MPITPLPTPVPSRADPANFAARGDAFLAALPAFATEANATAAEVNANAAICQSAAQTVNVSAWVSGTTYAVGDNRFDPVTFLTYRRKTAGAGTTSPGLDGTNWQLLTGFGDVDSVSNQTIGGTKTFSSPIAGSITGNAATATNANAVTNGVYTIGNQTIGGSKTFTNTIAASNITASADISAANITASGNITGNRFVGDTWSALANMPAGAVGSLALLFSGANITTNTTYAGSSLFAQGISRAADSVGVISNGTGPVQSGTWRALGTFTSGNGGLALFVRIA